MTATAIPAAHPIKNPETESPTVEVRWMWKESQEAKPSEMTFIGDGSSHWGMVNTVTATCQKMNKRMRAETGLHPFLIPFITSDIYR
ncbi:hypothetical protein ANABIO32_10370 [Rossellomorea marisflavi]|nr:hypothetical protein ANABIO32_10370 [Rossellomorea marisflavi]